jgi:ribosomal protein S6 kinase beta
MPNVAGLTCIANFDECWMMVPMLDCPMTTAANRHSFVGLTYVRPTPILEEVQPSSWA